MSLTDAQRILQLRKQLTEHSFRYYVTNSAIISDQEYDTLFKELLGLEKIHPEMGDVNSPTMRVGSPIPSGLRKVRHRVKMQSLDNIENLEKAMQFFSKYRSHDATIEMKIDGLSLHLSYKKGKLVQAITRGNGMEGEDVTENARTVRTIPLELRKPVDIEVRGEIYWRLSAFLAFNKKAAESKQYANPRNGAAGAMRQKDSRETAKCRLDFVAYSVPTDLPTGIETQEGLLEYLEMLGFRSPMTLDVTRDMAGLPFVTAGLNPNEILAAIDFLNDYRKALDMDTDGLVIKISSLAAQRDIGEGERSPRWAAAYKFPPEAKETKLLKVIVQVGKTGQVTPVAQLEPVSLGGAVIQRASLCNQRELNKLGIDIGDYVLVQRSGEVIPKVVGLARPSSTKQDVNKSYQLPKTCPCCVTPLIRYEEQVHMYCPNELCHDQVYARLVYATSDDALNIDGCGDVGVKILMEQAGVKLLSDLFKISDWSFFKPAQRKRVQESIEKARTAPLWRKVSALSIDGIGKVSAQDLSAKYATLIDMYQDEVGLKETVGEVAGDNLRRWVEDHVDELERLAEAGFILREDKKNTGVLSGKTFCITGKMVSGARDEVSALVESHGGIVKGAVTQKVNFLVQGEGGGNNKAADATKWGTQLITEEELYQMIGIPMPIRTRNLDESELA